MKKLICILVLLMFTGLAFGQSGLPPCNPNNPPPGCTDYFGVANWANSPLPAGAITGFTVVASGSGYISPQIFITDLAGTGATAPSITLDSSNGIASVSGGGGGGGYIAPQITVMDAGPCDGVIVPCGSGALITATIGGTVTGGMRKFVDPLPALSIAVPDTVTFPGSDFYVIALQDYYQKMHSDLPPTKLRGYVQLNQGTDANNANTIQPPAISYLGPVIVAQKNRPVRVLFKNMLTAGSTGNLYIPVDTTYMGAGAPFTQNRATLHLHGGVTPWISDGTPHQWTAPFGESGPGRGSSVGFVPDMWFDANGNMVPAGTAGATNDPGPGNLTFFWTNQQGGRLMFYHDHAYGITRLNVYAGEAAGYLLYDPAEEAGLAAATVPGTIAAGDLAHLIPLVLQDKTFVPSAPQLNFQDPTWLAGGYGTVPGSANVGDLWFPHVYTTNQNPSDPVGGANAFGRWDYGPWTLPGNQTSLLAANPNEAVDVPCTSSAFPNEVVRCPIIPNPSGTPEGFMDTPVINGVAYPVMHVAPEAYRFKILAAGNDRSWNLQLYVADPTVTTPDNRTNTEVKMVPAIQPSAGSPLPLCTAVTPITNTMLFLGLATALLDSNGNPVNNTGLPANCWPIFGTGTQTAGIPVQQTMWPADGRAGGVPDPTMAGPPFVQIGSEGGLLPSAVVIPSMPIGYEANTRSVTITNVSVHGLWLGPAERADVIVDFSKFANKTLILYNDAPTPAPAVDSRLDYFTGDGDQTPIGGAPNTLPGYGPNTRTLMQIVVDQPASQGAVPFSLPTLHAALPSLFAQTQPVPVVPEPTYPPASGGYSPNVTYSRISDASLTFFPAGSTAAVTINDERKTIQELFTLDYGRMNATLGVELPLTNFLTQTTIPLGYIDPPTEIIKQGDTQLWHITHNGVDTHFIHFHLFNVQVINRSGWDGSIRPPDQNELGWKDTVRMNPLEDILVALQPITPTLPFPIPDSYRLMDVTMMTGSDCPAAAPGQPSPLPCSIFTNVDPASNNPLNTPNQVQDFGWEYVWHCHILGHEENDMMRAIAFNVPPEAPSGLVVADATLAQPPGTGLNITWTDNSASETGFIVERDIDPSFPNPVSTQVGPSTPTDSNNQGTTWGGRIVYNDTGANTTGPFYYRVQAIKPLASYWSSGVLSSAWSNTAGFGPTASVSPATLAFGTVAVNTPSVAQSVTLSNTGAASFTYTAAISPTTNFAVTADPCAGSVGPAATCTISVTFTPSTTGPLPASLIITTSDLANPTLTVSLTGAGGSNPLLTITASNSTMKYGGVVPVISPMYNPPNPTGLTLPICTTTATNTSPVGVYPSTCSGASGPYTITYVAGSVTITPVPLTIWAPNASVALGNPVPTNFTPSYIGFVAGDTAASLTTPPTCTTTATSASPLGNYPITCTGAVDPNYTISYVAGTLTIAPSVLTITAPSPTMPYGGPIPTLTPTYNPANPVGLTTPAVCTTTATTSSPVGTYPITCTGAVDPNYSITYVAGTLTVTPATLTATVIGSQTYGGTSQTFSVSNFAGFVNGDTASLVTGTLSCTTSATSSSPVGSYAVLSCSGLSAPNYSISYAYGAFTVNPAPLTATVIGSQTYGGTNISFSVSNYAGFVSPDTASVVSGTLTCSSNATNTSPVGSGYTVSACSGLTASNYTISYAYGAFTVNPAPLTATVIGSQTYGGTNIAFSVSNYATFVSPDTASVVSGTLTCSTNATSTSPVGSGYAVSACSGLAASNYTISYAYGAFTVNPAPLIITASSASMLYYGAVPTITPIYTGFVVGDTSSVLITQPTCLTTATSTSNVGTYPSSCSGASAANYTISYVAGTVTITPQSTATAIVSGVPNPSAPNQAVTVNFMVTPQIPGTPLSGNVKVAASTGEKCGPVAISANGTGSCTITFATVGTRTLTASYLGTANFTASTSAPYTQTVSTGPVVTLSSTSLNFGNVNVGTSSTLTETVSNSGSSLLTINSIAVTGAAFSWVGGTCTNGGSVAVNTSCTIVVRFSPTARATYNGTLTINDNAANSPQTVALSGRGR